MQIAELLTPSNIILDLDSKTNEQAIEAMLQYMQQELHCLSAEQKESILQGFLDKEEQVSSGIGYGVAIPHFRTELIKAPLMVYAHSHEGINFHAPDQQPVHFLFMLLVPEDQKNEHLAMLAALAKLVRSAVRRKSLKGAVTAEQVLTILTTTIPD